jgi:hypothetical protein
MRFMFIVKSCSRWVSDTRRVSDTRPQGLTKGTMRCRRCEVVLWDARMGRRNEPETALRDVPMR